jgi:crotonobetainyl-CoA:carnitine CoA-transferase CaiB-like acyl-CoA transferase
MLLRIGQAIRTGNEEQPRPALEGIKVVDASTIFAGPVIAMLLGDHGAEVVKVEHPDGGDTLRSFGWSRDGESLWWAVVGRNKRSVTARLSDERGAEILRRLVADADVLIENFRPGTLERWGLGPERLLDINPRLVVARTTGFGQTGPYKDRPGFGTLAESISGFAHINGHPDGPPTLPAFALGDGVAALMGAFAVMTALWWRDHGGGRGQVIDLSLYEPLFWILGPQATVYDQLGIVQGRSGNRLPFSAPRNAYRTRDDRWLALSGSSQSIAQRVLRLVGRADLAEQPWFADHAGRMAHQDELDAAIASWIAARDAADVIAAFERAQAAIAPILSIEDIVSDPQYLARETVTTVDHPVLGPLRMQGVVPRFSATPGRVASPGPALGEHTEDVLRGLGYGEEELAVLAADGVIATRALTGVEQPLE